MEWNRFAALLVSIAMMGALASCQSAEKQEAGSTSSYGSAESSIGDTSTGEASEPAAMPVEISFEQVNAAAFAEDDTMLLDCSYMNPTINMMDKTVQEKIQSDLDGEIASLLAEREHYVELSREEYAAFDGKDDSLMVDENGKYVPYYLNVEACVPRADSKVISILFRQFMYTHGAHGGSLVWGCNYDAETGERIVFSQLGENFRKTAEKLVLEKADEIAAAGITDDGVSPFYPDYEENIHLVVMDGTETMSEIYGPPLEGALEEEQAAQVPPTFFFTDTGITFISNEYCLQPYAAGTVELEVPYELFGEDLGTEWLPNK